jgi:hypothetical protein
MPQPQHRDVTLATLQAERDLAIGQNLRLRLLASAMVACLDDIVTVCGDGLPGLQPQLNRARGALDKARETIRALQP